MAMGMLTATLGDWLPIVKFDSRSGRLFRVDKIDGQNIPTEIPLNTTFGVDFGTLEAGYCYFSLQQGPVRQMVPYHEGVAMPTQPTERDDQNRLLYRPGFYIKVIGNAFVTDGQGSGSVREWVSNASSLLNAMDDLYLRYKAAPEAAAGKIPVVAITGANPIKTGSGTRASTNYAPIFEIRSWAPRPEPMLGPRTTPIPGQEPPAAVKINGGSTPLPPTPPVTQTAPVTQTRPEAWETTIPATSAPVQKAAPTPDAMPF